MPQSELKAFGGHVDMSVERAVCALLMGDPLAAESALRVAPDSVAEPDKGVANFVLVRSIAHCTLRPMYPFLVYAKTACWQHYMFW
jgi:hypothetical protein